MWNKWPDSSKQSCSRVLSALTVCWGVNALWCVLTTMAECSVWSCVQWPDLHLTISWSDFPRSRSKRQHEKMTDPVLFSFLLRFYRQIQRLRDSEGAKCEEHHRHRAWKPAVLGAGLHVVSCASSSGHFLTLLPERYSAIVVSEALLFTERPSWSCVPGWFPSESV